MDKKTPIILEVFSMSAIMISGLLGLWFAFHDYTGDSFYIIVTSSLLIFLVCSYTAVLSELMQKQNKVQMFICKLTHRLIYAIFALQLISIIYSS